GSLMIPSFHPGPTIGSLAVHNNGLYSAVAGLRAFLRRGVRSPAYHAAADRVVRDAPRRHRADGVLGPRSPTQGTAEQAETTVAAVRREGYHKREGRRRSIMSIDWKTRITLDPAVLAGKPTIRGLRISVEHILRALSAGVPPEEILAEYPD